MKSIVFINPPGPPDIYRGSICTYLSKAKYVWKPKDFIILSGLVPRNIPIHFLDASINRISPKGALSWLAHEKPEVIVIALSSITWEADFHFLINSRKQHPNAQIFVFGEVLLESSLANKVKSYANDIIYDPLRYNLREALEGKPSAQKNPIANNRKKTPKLISTCLPKHELFDHVRYRWPFVKHKRFASVYTQYGCPFKCSYCTESITNVSYRPSQEVLAEMNHIWKLGYREVHIGDASFGFPKENARRIIEGMVQKGFEFGWSSYVHPLQIDSNMLKLMARSGCHTLVIGLDSADTELLKSYGRYVEKSQIDDFIRRCHRENIAVCGDIMLGFPKDTEQSCEDTIRYAIKSKIDYASINLVSPLMGTKIREELQQNSTLDEGETGFETSGRGKIAPTTFLSPEQLSEIRSNAVRRFYLRPTYLLRRLFNIRSLEELSIQMEEGFGIAKGLIASAQTRNS